MSGSLADMPFQPAPIKPTEFDEQRFYERKRKNAQVVASVWMAIAEQLK